MLSGVGWALAVAALLAGVTGTWSPCGLSTIDSLRRGGMHRGGVPTVLGASVAFAGGALAGGVLTFGGLALLGSLVSGAGASASSVAVAIAVAAAALELRGSRIVPQVRRQVPESWRRRLPIGLAAAAYGVLLGLGLTTFVMTFAVWALAAISVALGSPVLGLVIGLSFGAGRALPVLVLAPAADRDLGGRVIDTMLQLPAVLRALRMADGAALIACAVSLAGPALAATAGDSGDVDPSAQGTALAYEQLGVGGFEALSGAGHQLPGDDPAVGGGLIAWLDGDTITVANQATLAPELTIPAPGADELALSASWLAYRVPPSGDQHLYEIYAVSLTAPGPPYVVAAAQSPFELGRPAIDGDSLLFAASGTLSRIVSIDLATGVKTVLRKAVDAQLLSPSASGGRLLYVRVDDCTQRLELGRLTGGTDRTIASSPTEVARDGGYEPGAIREGRTPNHCIGPRAGQYTETVNYWTTALSTSTAYLTVLRTRGASTAASIERFGA